MGPKLIKDLGDGLILRRAALKDVDALAEFNSRVHSDDGWDKPDLSVAAWTRDLIFGRHPTVSADDFTIIEGTTTSRIISSMNLISQVWSYSGISFNVGQPEIVGTHPDYRHRRLVSEQFTVIHEWSHLRGQVVQGITGIPYYYRRFGYEMAVDLDGARIGYESLIPSLKEGETELYCFSSATPEDIPFLKKCHHIATSRSLLSCIRDHRAWLWYIQGNSRDNLERLDLYIIRDTGQNPLGYIAVMAGLHDKRVKVREAELLPGTPWQAVLPSLLRFIWKLGLAAGKLAGKTCEGYRFTLHEAHPLFEAGMVYTPKELPAYAWYLRVPDPKGFLWKIRPVLEKNLSVSSFSGFNGELCTSFYEHGLKWKFDKGDLKQIETWQPTPSEWGDAAFPNLTFLQLLFGYRSIDELEYAFADCWTKKEFAHGLLNALFPRRPSQIWSLI